METLPSPSTRSQCGLSLGGSRGSRIGWVQRGLFPSRERPLKYLCQDWHRLRCPWCVGTVLSQLQEPLPPSHPPEHPSLTPMGPCPAASPPSLPMPLVKVWPPLPSPNSSLQHQYPVPRAGPSLETLDQGSCSLMCVLAFPQNPRFPSHPAGAIPASASPQIYSSQTLPTLLPSTVPGLRIHIPPPRPSP